MATETIMEAQAHFSELVARAVAGETILLTEKTGSSPVVRIEAVDAVVATAPIETSEAVGRSGPRRLGFMEHLGIPVPPDSFFDPLTEEELIEWGL